MIQFQRYRKSFENFQTCHFAPGNMIHQPLANHGIMRRFSKATNERSRILVLPFAAAICGGVHPHLSWASQTMNKLRPLFVTLLSVTLSLSIFLISCNEVSEVITKPDEFKNVYEASEAKLIAAIARVFTDKGYGEPTINREKNEVESEYLIQDDWRTKCIARVKKLDWKECEVALTVITEKKTSEGWEMRRLLGPKQFETFFYAIELQLYQEMYKVK